MAESTRDLPDSDIVEALASTNRWVLLTGRPGTRAASPRLGPGGLLGGFRTGHWEVTREVAERFGFSPDAVAILKDASQDPDFYEFKNPTAHAQTPDTADEASGKDREGIVSLAQRDYTDWVVSKVRQARDQHRQGNSRDGLFLLGYALHGVEDLAVHSGRTNGEHAANHPSPDHEPAAIALARSYAERFLRGVSDVFGTHGFDAVRAWKGDSLSRAHKCEVLGKGGWDVDPEALLEYKKLGSRWKSNPESRPVRWPVEAVLGDVLSQLERMAISEKGKVKSAATEGAEPEASDSFVALSPIANQDGCRRAAWTVMVYMAGDDPSPNGIEYAVRQDLMELKAVGSTDRVNLLAQTDEAHVRNSYRYRLRNGTPLEADRLAVFYGDLNTGRVKTLVEFARWAITAYPAERYALVLWGHGSGHDDADVYRLARGRVSPRVAAQLASKRLGFFGGTRRALVERLGPARGYGFDETARDFLDNVELESALSQISRLLDKPLDLLGFDACLMAMTEVAYQVRRTAEVMVASQFSEPGDGWCYSTALASLALQPGLTAEQLGQELVKDFGLNYPDQTLSCLRLGGMATLGQQLARLALEIGETQYQHARRRATDCLPGRRGGYRDLGTFLDSLGAPAEAAKGALAYVVVESRGPATGLGVYAPSEYSPDEAGSTDQLYESLAFPRECGWSSLLRRVLEAGNVPIRAGRVAPATRPIASNGSLYGLDRNNVWEGSREESTRGAFWPDRLRALLNPTSLVEQALTGAADALLAGNLRILIVPGIMGSMLSDRAGQHGLCWIDPVGLVAGCDFEALQLDRDGMRDADRAVRIESVSAVPVIYDRLALALMLAFGPVVEYFPYDWRRGVRSSGARLAARLDSLLSHERRRVVLVAHSMGGLVAADAVNRVKQSTDGLLGLVSLGTPWMGSCAAALSLRGESEQAGLFSRLTALGLSDVTKIVQSFWGLTDLLPLDPGLCRADLYTMGPLGDPARASERFHSVERVRETVEQMLASNPLSGGMLAVFADHLPTAVPGATPSSNQLCLEYAGGDGTVSAWSATAQGRLPSKVVHAEHVMLPLDGAAIQTTTAWIWRRLHQSEPPTLPALPDLTYESRGGRDRLLMELGNIDEVALPLARLRELMFLA